MLHIYIYDISHLRVNVQPYPPPSYRHCRVEVEVKHLSRSKQSSAIFRNRCHCYHGQNIVRTPVFILMSNAGFEKKAGEAVTIVFVRKLGNSQCVSSLCFLQPLPQNIGRVT